jgi:hypothetical protein
MKSLVMLTLILTIYQTAKAAAMSAIKTDKTCYSYAINQEQLEIPFDAFCFDSTKVYFYNKFALYAQNPIKTANKTEVIAKIYKTLPTEGVEPSANTENPYGIYSLLILTEKGTVIYMDKYNYETEGEFSFGNSKYQYKKNYELEYSGK